MMNYEKVENILDTWCSEGSNHRKEVTSGERGGRSLRRVRTLPLPLWHKEGKNWAHIWNTMETHDLKWSVISSGMSLLPCRGTKAWKVDLWNGINITWANLRLTFASTQRNLGNANHAPLRCSFERWLYENRDWGDFREI